MRMVVVLLKINDTIIELGSLKPCIYIAASVVDLAVDILRLILHLVVSIVSPSESVIEHVLCIVNN